jgi:molybdopterin-binding protein
VHNIQRDSKSHRHFVCGDWMLYLKYKDLQGEVKMKISARNILKGKVKEIKIGMVNTEVIVELPGGLQMVSVITKESAENLGLAKGKDVYAVVKASNVMIAVD